MAKRSRLFIILFTSFLFILLQIIVFSTYQHQLNIAYAHVKEELTNRAITLSSVTDERFALLQGITSFLRTVGFDADSETIMRFLQNIYHQSNGIRSILVAPNGFISYVYPIEGNEALLETSYMTHPELASPELLQETLVTRQIIIDGPRELKQGGLGIVARQAIYEEDVFKGIIAITLNFNDLIERSTLDEVLSENNSFVISKSDGTPIYGNSSTLTQKHASVPVQIFNDEWVLAANPTPEVKKSIFFTSVMYELVGIIIIALQFHTFRRQFLFNLKLEREVAQRTKALQNANHDLLAVEEELRYQNELLENRTVELELSERKYEQLAYSDILTKISNRLYFIEKMSMRLTNPRFPDTKMAVCFFDINQFNLVNDTFGHSVGDKLLQEIAKRISNSSIGYSIFARLGGDEFVLVFDDVADIVNVQDIVTRIVDLFDEPFEIEQLHIHSSVRIGIALYPEHGQTLEELMKHADLAMHYAKTKNELPYQFFNSTMMVKLLQKRDFPTLFNKALENKEIELYFQPQVDISSQSIIGVEALVRWNHPEKGMIQPSEFIYLAEEMGLITELTDYVIDHVCRQSQMWKQKGLPPVKIALNLSSAWLFKQNVVERFFSTLQRYQVDPKEIELEITENIAVMDECYPALEAFLRAGVTVSIDDFGRAYSSLSYLKRFPINKIKIDRSFITGIGQNHIDETIIQAIRFITNKLGYELLAEGVETEEQAVFLQTNGCLNAQGFLYYKPMPAAQIEQLL